MGILTNVTRLFIELFIILCIMMVIVKLFPVVGPYVICFIGLAGLVGFLFIKEG